MLTTSSLLTLEDYLNYDDGTDARYELVDGELVITPPESDKNNLIALYLLYKFLEFLPFSLIRHKDTEIVVTGNRARVRLPDLMVLTEELVKVLAGKRATITPDMPAPLLVVEVVSPGKINEDRDYRYKRSEYAARGILEYWVVDAMQVKVTVFTLVEGFYEESIFSGDSFIISAIFPDLQLQAQDIFTAGEYLPPTE
jgi:Uma2 family endonuclease